MSPLLASSRGLVLAATLSLLTAVISAHAALPKPSGCTRLAEALPSSADDLGCVSHTLRIDLLNRNVAPAVIAPLNREYQLHSALHRWKAKEAAALAVPADVGNNPLASYLDGRAIESLRSEALKGSQRALAQADARILLLGADLKAASRAATQWIHRQPGRDLPSSYVQRIIDAADAILDTDRLRRAGTEERDEINRRFDLKLQQVLTMQG